MALGLVVSSNATESEEGNYFFLKAKKETLELGKSYAALRPEQKRLVDDFVQRYDAAPPGSNLIPEQAYDNARLSDVVPRSTMP